MADLAVMFAVVDAPTIKDAAIGTVRVVALLWVAVVLTALLGQRWLMYRPYDDAGDPARFGIAGLTATLLTTPDGERVLFWRMPAAPGKPTLLFFHGNAGNVSLWNGHYKRYHAEGWGLMAMSYRGFSGSSGRPSEKTNVADALLAYNALTAEGIVAADIVLYGASLGTGVAMQVAAQRPVAAIVLETPFDSVVAVAAERYWFLPVNFAINDRYDSVRHAASVTAPVLILGAGSDPVVPIHHARRLAEAIRGDKRMVEFPLAGHTDTYSHGAFDAVRDCVNRTRQQS